MLAIMVSAISSEAAKATGRVGDADQGDRFLLVTPCDPGNCHIYFGVQIRALPTALALASRLKRTLVLPPFEWYENQAQDFANAFRRTPSGRSPRFSAWSSLFDLDRLRAAGVDGVDWTDAHAAMQKIDRLLLQTGHQAPMGKKTVGRMAEQGQQQQEEEEERGAKEVAEVDPLATALTAVGCKAGRDGLQANLTWDGQHRAVGATELYGERGITFSAPMRCGSLQMNDRTIAAIAEWIGEARTVAIFNIGHQTHTRVGVPEMRSTVADALRPNPALDAEAARFLRDAVDPHRLLAVHWRHGDYVAYELLTPLHALVARVHTALAKLECGALHACRVFLMTNCRNESALAEFATEMPPAISVLRYEPTRPFFATEGGRLVIEQSIASRADAFVPSGRSAVSEYVEMLRRARGSRTLHGKARDITAASSSARKGKPKVEL